MLLSQKSRFYVRNQFSLRPQRGQGAGLPLLADDDTMDFASIVEGHVKAGTASFDLKLNDTMRITKIEARPKDGMLVLLFRRRDEEASTQVLEHKVTGKLRSPTKAPEEAPAISCHLFINLAETKTPHPTHRALLEEVPGIGRTYVQKSLQRLVRPVVYGYTDRKGRQRETYTLPTLDGIPSETLGSAVKGGGINYVELVRPPRLDGLDTEGLIPHLERMRLSVRAEHSGPMSMVQRIRAWANDHDWADMRVQVETSDDRTRVVQIARGADAADVLFIRSELVGTQAALAQCTDQINDELVGHARRLFAKDQGW
jgi:hypothetical protein